MQTRWTHYQQLALNPKFGATREFRGDGVIGTETVGSIECGGNLTLNGTTVTGTAEARGNIQASGCPSLKKLESSQGGIVLSRSSLTGKAEARNDIEAENCPQLGKLETSLGGVTVRQCPSIEAIASRGNVRVEGSKVHGKVESDLGAVQLENSEAERLSARQGLALKGSRVSHSAVSEYGTLVAENCPLIATAKARSDIKILNSNVTEKVESEFGSVTVKNTTQERYHCGNVSAGEDILLEQIHQVGKVTAEWGGVQIEKAQTVGRVNAKTHIKVIEAQKVGDLSTTQGAVHAQKCGSISKINGYGGVVVESCPQVAGVRSDIGPVTIKNSEVQGPVQVKNGNLTIENARIQSLILLKPGSGGGSTVVNTSGGMINSTINGFNVSSYGSVSLTTVTTPEGITYLNGRKSSGEGPMTYAGYRRQHPEDAITIQAPGWVEQPADLPVEGGDLPPTLEVLDLTQFANTTIGEIIFQSGQGKVLVPAGFDLKPEQVQGGIIEVKS